MIKTKNGKKLLLTVLSVLLVVAAVFSLTMFSASAGVTEYAVYVDGTNGNDTNDGTEANPVATTDAAYKLLQAHFAEVEASADQCVGKINVLTDCYTVPDTASTNAGMFTEKGTCVILNKSGAAIGKVIVEGAGGGVTVTGDRIKTESSVYVTDNFDIRNITYKTTKDSSAVSYVVGAFEYALKDEALASDVVFGEGFSFEAANTPSVFMGRASDGCYPNSKCRDTKFTVLSGSMNIGLANSNYYATSYHLGTIADPYTSTLIIGGNAVIGKITGMGYKMICDNFVADITVKDNAEVTNNSNLLCAASNASAAEMDFEDNVDITFRVLDNANVAQVFAAQRASYKTHTIHGSITFELDSTATIKQSFFAYNPVGSTAANLAERKAAIFVDADFNAIYNNKDNGTAVSIKDTNATKIFNYRAITYDGKLSLFLNGGKYTDASSANNKSLMSAMYVYMREYVLKSEYGSHFEMELSVKNVCLFYENTDFYLGFISGSYHKNDLTKYTLNLYEGITFDTGSASLSNLNCSTSSGGENVKYESVVNVYANIPVPTFRATAYSSNLVGNVTVNFAVPEGGSPYTFTPGIVLVGTGSIKGNVTLNYGEGVTFSKELCPTLQSEKGSVTGTITNNFNGAAFSGVVYGGNATYKAAALVNNFNKGTFTGKVYGSKLGSNIPNLTNNVYGCTFNSTFSAVNNGGTFAGSITNNFRDNPTFKVTTFLSSDGKLICHNTVTNNIYSATFEKYFGCGANGSTSEIDNLVNNVYGGTFKSYYLGNSYSQSLKGNITNNIFGAITFPGAYYGASCNDANGVGTITGNVTNNIKADPKDSSKVPTFNTTFRALGGATKCTGTVTNNIEAGNFKGEFYGTDFCTFTPTSGTITIGAVVNNITGGKFMNSTMLAGSSSKVAFTITGNVTNTIDGAEIEFAKGLVFACGTNNYSSVEGKIINTISNTSFKNTGTGSCNVVFGNYNSSNAATTNVVKGGIETEVYDITTNIATYLGSYNGTVGVEGVTETAVKAIVNGLVGTAGFQITPANRAVIYGDYVGTFNKGNQTGSFVLGSYGGDIKGEANVTINGGSWGNVIFGGGKGFGETYGTDADPSYTAKLTVNGGAIAKVTTNNYPCEGTVLYDLSNGKDIKQNNSNTVTDYINVTIKSDGETNGKLVLAKNAITADTVIGDVKVVSYNAEEADGEVLLKVKGDPTTEYICIKADDGCEEGAHILVKTNGKYTYTSDADNHYVVCSNCGVNVIEEMHEFDDYVCSVCGYIDLDTAKSDAKYALSEAAGAEPSAAVEGLVANGEGAIDLAQTLAEVAQAKETALGLITDQKTLESNQAILDQAKETQIQRVINVGGEESVKAAIAALADANAVNEDNTVDDIVNKMTKLASDEVRRINTQVVVEPEEQDEEIVPVEVDETTKEVIGQLITEDDVKVAVKAVQEVEDTEKDEIENEISAIIPEKHQISKVFFDLSVIKTEGANDPEKVTELPSVAKFSIAFERADDAINVKVFRFHGEEVDVLTTEPNGEGEYFEIDTENNAIVLHVKKLCTFGATYETPAQAAANLETDKADALAAIAQAAKNTMSLAIEEIVASAVENINAADNCNTVEDIKVQALEDIEAKKTEEEDGIGVDFVSVDFAKDLTLKFKLTEETATKFDDNPTAEITVLNGTYKFENGEQSIVDVVGNWVEENDGKFYVFEIKGINPSQIGNRFNLRLKGEIEGTPIKALDNLFSVSSYLYEIIDATVAGEYDELHPYHNYAALAKALLNYGAAAQQYVDEGIDPKDLVNAKLDDSDKLYIEDLGAYVAQFAGDEVKKPEGYEEFNPVDYEKTSWISSALVLEDTPHYRVKFSSSTEDLVIVANVNLKNSEGSGDYTYFFTSDGKDGSKKFCYDPADGYYYVEFDEFNMDEMSTQISFVAYTTDANLPDKFQLASQEFTTSVESYVKTVVGAEAAVVDNFEDLTNLSKLLIALEQVGNAAENVVSTYVNN